MADWKVIAIYEGPEWETPSPRPDVIGSPDPEGDPIHWYSAGRFRVVAEERLGSRIEIEAEPAYGQQSICVTRVCIDGTNLDAADLQSVPLQRLATEGLRGVTFFQTAKGRVVSVRDASDKELRDLFAAVLPDRGSWTGGRLTDDQLRHVASAYRLLIDFGSRKPTQAIAELIGKPRSTVARWIGEARKRGLLPAAERGKASAGTVDDLRPI